MNLTSWYDSFRRRNHRNHRHHSQSNGHPVWPAKEPCYPSTFAILHSHRGWLHDSTLTTHPGGCVWWWLSHLSLLHRHPTLTTVGGVASSAAAAANGKYTLKKFVAHSHIIILVCSFHSKSTTGYNIMKNILNALPANMFIFRRRTHLIRPLAPNIDTSNKLSAGGGNNWAGMKEYEYIHSGGGRVFVVCDVEATFVSSE